MKKLALALTLVCLLGPASTHAQNAYITNQGSNTVSDPRGRGGEPRRQQGITNVDSNTVSVIGTATNTVSATIPVGHGPVAFGVFIQPASRFAGVPGLKTVSARASRLR
jgi:YVTN family beta-propeller protein